jgi:hypothetical protein
VAVLSRIQVPANLSAFIRGAVYGSPMVDQIRARGGDPDAVVTALEAAFHKEFGTPCRLPLQAIIFEAIRA